MASRLFDAERSGEAERRDAVARWMKARADGLTAQQAAEAVGHSRATLFRWQRQPIPGSRRPHRAPQRQWTDEMAEAVRHLRADNPMWGRVKIAGVLRREGWTISVSTVGRILGWLMRRGVVTPVPQLRRKSAAAPRRVRRKHAKRLPKGTTSQAPGEIVQIDTMTINPGHARPTIKHFTAADPVSKWTCGKAFRNATAKNAERFLKAVIDEMPFPVKAIQVDGGSEFMAEFEAACEARKLPLYILPPRSPKLNGHVERCNGTWRYEFDCVWELNDTLKELNEWVAAFADEFNHYRPHQGLDGATPAEYLERYKAEEDASVSHVMG